MSNITCLKATRCHVHPFSYQACSSCVHKDFHDWGTATNWDCYNSATCMTSHGYDGERCQADGDCHTTTNAVSFLSFLSIDIHNEDCNESYAATSVVSMFCRYHVRSFVDHLNYNRRPLCSTDWRDVWSIGTLAGN